ncbi:hypothetical protein ABVK25_010573 [Lepraria finkii]|uniref:Zinc finger C2H2 LYAR-type domain-containing protein n=1 Tax=Lepraria finkii TaxID=1340010 RepID=A0ABR4AWX0_9LECA
MVSFSCEGCGNILTKKKLDGHHRQCRGSSFTCLDCMTHFGGTEYRVHTSCISEDQKYQGALYKGKETKEDKKKVKISESTSSKSRKAFVEDADDADTGKAITIVDPPQPPPAHSPQ